MNGLLIVDKPEGLTSADVVRYAKRLLRVKTGHLGTLDPFASGVLPLCVGDGTKIAQFLNEADKEYQGVINLGAATDTGDVSGTVLEEIPVPSLTDADMARAAAAFTGELEQVPPMYSAIKRQGTPLYKLARQGIEVERQPRRVSIRRLNLEIRDERHIDFVVACSKGTYIRVLAADIAISLGTAGHLGSLRRTRFGRFDLTNAISLEQLAAEAPPVIGLSQALGHLREVRLNATDAGLARRGFVPLLRSYPHDESDEHLKLIDETGQLAAVVTHSRGGPWRYARVFN
jgi:tRNA pseudouridine55 synthase